MKRIAHLLLAIAAVTLVSAEPAEKAKPGPADDPAAIKSLRGNALVGFRLSADGNIDSINCSYHDAPLPGLSEEASQAMRREATKALRGLHHVKELYLEKACDDELAWIEDLTSITSLDVSGRHEDSRITDGGLVHLRKLTHLQSLVLEGASKVTDEGLKNLASMTQLVELDLRGTSIRGAGLKHLTALRDLQSLDLSHTNLDDEAILGLLALPKLRDLDLGHTMVTNKSLPLLAKLPRGATVSVGETTITRKAVYATPGARETVFAGKFADDLAPELYGEAAGLGAGGNAAHGGRDDDPDDGESANALRATRLVHCDFGKEGSNIVGISWAMPVGEGRDLLARLAGLHHLRTLSIETELADGDSAFLKSLTTLESLDLSRTRITDSGLANLKMLRRLTYLRLPKSKLITDAGIANLRGLIELDNLSLDGTAVHGKGLKDLRPLTKLSRLSLDGTPVNDDDMTVIGSLKSLTDLDLTGTRVTDDGLAKLNGLHNLASLTVFDTKVTRAGGQRLRATHPRLNVFYPLSEREESMHGPPRRGRN